jgi:nucleotide-binding universal stress UspA family protein
MATPAPQVALALRNILVATDFSPCSERALLHAVAAAHHCGSTLHLVHVVQPKIFSILPPEAHMGTQDVLDLALKQANTEARTLVTDVLQRTHCEDVKHRIWVQQGAAVGEPCAPSLNSNISTWRWSARMVGLGCASSC